MTNGMSFVENIVKEQMLNIHTGYLGKVMSIKGSTARVQPLTVYKPVGGEATEQSLVSAVIPQNLKFKTERISYMVSETEKETRTILVPAALVVGDIVFVGVCDRDITYAKNGVISEATQRHHNINDGVILRVL